VRTVNPSLLLLILVWVALLLPGALRSHRRSSPRVTVGGFQRAMDGLRVNDRVDATQVWREDPVVVRRRQRFLRLLTASLLSILAASLLGGAAWLVAAGLVSVLGITTAVLRRLQVQRVAARSVLTRLDLRRPAQPLVDEITGELILAAGSSGTSVRLRAWGD
jgi:hypothetical protein